MITWSDDPTMFPGEEAVRRLVVRLQGWYRRVRGLCLMCGARREKHFDCYHCVTQAKRRLCHQCSKTLNFGRAYGMSSHRLAQAMTGRFSCSEPNLQVIDKPRPDDGLDAARGIVNGIALGIPIWTIVAWVWEIVK